MERVSWNNVITFRDLVQRLRLRRNLNSSESEEARLRIAIDDAYRELPNKHRWKFYLRQVYLTTDAAVELGSGVYDHTGGAYERQLTIASGVWPANAIDGQVYFDNVSYDIERRVSDTVVVLSSEVNPGRDMTFTTTQWNRNRYRLATNVREIREVWQEGSLFRLLYAPSLSMNRIQQAYRTAGNPIQYAMQPSRDETGMMDFVLIPAPTEQRTYKVMVTAAPLPFRTYEVAGADGVLVSGSNQFTSASASFDDRMIGTLIRISPTASLPKGLHYLDSQRKEYVFQSIVRRVVNATTLELTQAPTFSASARGYSISDIADLDQRSMLTYLEALAWEYFSTNTQGDEDDKIDLARQRATQSLRSAISAEYGSSFEYEDYLFGFAWWPVGSNWTRFTKVSIS